MLVRNEAARLDALHALNLLDSTPSEAFDRITRLASRLFDVPIALVSLIDADRQWFKSRVGVQVLEGARETAFCSYAIQSDQVMVVPDATQDARFCTNPLVLAQPGIRFYAGAPLITADGHAIGTLCVIDDKPRRLALEDQRVLADLASMVMAQIDLRHAIGRVDPTSSLPNRSSFLEALEYAALAAPRERRMVVVVDLAGPRQMDDLLRVLGPCECETLVRAGAGIVREVLGPGVTVYHVDTLRFAAVIEDADAFTWHAPAERLLERLRAPVLCGGIPIRFTPGIGIVPFRLGATSNRDLLRRAITAAHDARRGGSGWAAYDPRTDQQQQRRFTLLTDLRRALEVPGELSLAYQPRIALASGACVGAEALLRWHHRTLGEVPPGEFVPIAEKTALIVPMTDWVMEAALRQAAAFRTAGLALRMSFNISARDLEHGDFPARLAAGLSRHSLPPQALEVEFTEGVLLQDSSAAREQLREVRMLGVELSIDDFGTGHSNLSYLQQIPASLLKLDQSFIRTLASSRRDRTIVRAMVAMAHDLGYRVVAEGVETEEIRGFVTEFGCDEAQGYQIARPMPADALSQWLNRGRLAELDRPMEVAAAE